MSLPVLLPSHCNDQTHRKATSEEVNRQRKGALAMEKPLYLRGLLTRLFVFSRNLHEPRKWISGMI